MKAWQFSTIDYPVERRPGEWKHAMGRLGLPIGQVEHEAEMHGSVSCLTSPLGIEFALVQGTAQEIAGRYPDQEAAIWLAMLLEGSAVLEEGEWTTDMAAGDIIYGPTGVDATLRYDGDFRMIFVRAPRLALGPRLVAPLFLRLGHLPGQSGIAHVFAGMLRSLADVLGEIREQDLRAVELALTEFLISSLAVDKRVFGLGGAAGVRAAHLHRICQTIETMLGEPNLTPSKVAEEHGVSLRYMQKLFTETGTSFSNYVRVRRLERCRTELISPLHSQLSISDICFRWGFNGSAHFSRTFRSHYGVSPREYRASNGEILDQIPKLDPLAQAFRENTPA